MPRASSGISAAVSSLVRRVVATPRSRLSTNGLPPQSGYAAGAGAAAPSDGGSTPRRGSSGLIARLSSFVGARRVGGDSILSTSTAQSRAPATNVQPTNGGGGGMFTPRRWTLAAPLGSAVAEVASVVQESVVIRQAGPVGPLSVRD